MYVVPKRSTLFTLHKQVKTLNNIDGGRKIEKMVAICKHRQTIDS